MSKWWFLILGFVFGISLTIGGIYYHSQKLPSGQSATIETLLPGYRRPIVFGFLPYWLVNKFNPQHLSSLTTLSYFGLVIGDDGHLVTQVSPQELDPGYVKLSSPELAAIFEQAKKEKIILSLTVYLQEDEGIDALLTDPISHAQNLIADVAPIMRQYQFTDLNIDIETFTSASPEARQNFTLFMEEVDRGMNQNQLGTLSLDLAPRAVIDDYIFDPVALGEVVDHVFLMTYDYHTRGSAIAGPVAPLGGQPTVRNFDVLSGLQAAQQTIPTHKLILGLPLYGYQWETMSAERGQPTVPRSGLTASLTRIEELMAECPTCQRHFDEVALQPYVVGPTTLDGIWQQYYYEDEESIQHKIKVAQEQKLGGIGLWALGYETEKTLTPLQKYKHDFLIHD